MKPDYEIDGKWYHGGERQAVTKLIEDKICTSSGGGELGKGFYIGNYGHEASAWAWHKYRKGGAVISLEVKNFNGSGLSKLELSRLSAIEKCIKIQKNGHTRTYVFSRDVVAAPIVGKIFKDTPTQLKWEGDASRNFLNSIDVVKRVTKL